MSATGNYVGLINDLDTMAARTGVSKARLQASHDSGATLSQPELRDVIAAIAGPIQGLSIATATKNSAVTENANVAHPTARKRERGDDRGPVL